MAVRRATLVLVLACAVFAGLADGRNLANVRVTVFGDSAATAMAYDPEAKRILGRGVDARLELASCRRVGDTSCPYDGVRPPNVIDRVTELGRELGRVVVVIVGYNDYESTYADNIGNAMAAFRKAGVERVLWATLRAERQSYANMNDDVFAAARRYPEMTVLDWNGLSKQHDDWLQPDGIHLTAEGARGMATMVNDALVALGVAPKAPPPRQLAIASHSLPIGHRRRPYAVTLRAVGGTAPYRWSRIGGGVPGLRLSVAGRLSGVPTKVGAFRLDARVVDAAGVGRVRELYVRIR